MVLPLSERLLSLVTKTSKVGVLYGGLSSEREVSIRSGKAMLSALQEKGYNAVGIEVGEDIVSVLVKNPIDVAVIGLHGKMGEDGTIQGLLECLRIPYTGSGVMASAIAMNKILTKKIAEAENIKTPPYEIFDLHKTKNLKTKIGFPCVVKAQEEGSSRGTTIVKKKKDFLAAIEEAAKYDHHILVEKYIEGPQITVFVFKEKTFPIVEIVPKSGFYDYYSKYTKGATEYIIPARISQKTKKAAEAASLGIFLALQCWGYARADFIVDKKGVPWFIEINTLPGMTETSLVPKSAAAAGLHFKDLVEEILLSATLNYGQITR